MRSTLLAGAIAIGFVTAVGCGGVETDEAGEQQYEVYMPPKTPLPPVDDPGDPGSFPRPSLCGNHRCDADDGESCRTCPADCGKCVPVPEPRCGDFTCDASAGETCQSCPGDCGSCCGNGICDGWEIPETCMADCGWPSKWKEVMVDTCIGGGPAPWSGDNAAGTVWTSIAMIPGLPDQVMGQVGVTILDKSGNVESTKVYPWYSVYKHSTPIKRIVSDTHSKVSFSNSDFSALGKALVKLGPGELIEFFGLTQYSGALWVTPCFRHIIIEEY